jgi:hypothetical protein
VDVDAVAADDAVGVEEAGMKRGRRLKQTKRARRIRARKRR